MPSTPPTSFSSLSVSLPPPFSFAANSLLSHTRHVFTFLSNAMATAPFDLASKFPLKSSMLMGFPFNSSSSSLSIDLSLLESKDFALESAIKRTTEIVSQSVKSTIKQFSPYCPTKSSCRVLVYGTHSFYRAKHLANIKDFPTKVKMLTKNGNGNTLMNDFNGNMNFFNENPIEHNGESDSFGGLDLEGGVYWCDDEMQLDNSIDSSPSSSSSPPMLFDSILCFNLMAIQKAEDSLRVIQKLSSRLRNGGALSGTGIFSNPSVLIGNPNSSHYTDIHDGLMSSTFSLRAFRDAVESIGFYFHSAIDLSLEGNLIQQCREDLHDAAHTTHNHEENQNLNHMGNGNGNHSGEERFRDGKMICGRFMATKNTNQIITQMGNGNPFSSSLSLSIPLPMSMSMPMPLSLPYPMHSFPLPSLYHSLPSSASQSSLSPTSTLSSLPPTPTNDSYIHPTPSLYSATVCVSGVSLGLPNNECPSLSVFCPSHYDSLFNGINFISNLTATDKQSIIDQNVFQVVKKDGKRVKYRLEKDSEVLQLASKIHHFDLSVEYPFIPQHVIETLDTTYTLAIAAGIEALQDAKIPIFNTDYPDSEGEKVIVGLPEEFRDSTGVIFASSFPCLDSTIEEVWNASRHVAEKNLKNELMKINEDFSTNVSVSPYEYDRKLLFKLLVMANAQLAEMIRARGPNTHINNACSGTTQSITIAEDWIRVGRAKRVIVISADNVTNSSMFPFVGSGFLALGAATTCGKVSEAAVPMDLRRKGMILGCGAVGLVIESASSIIERSLTPQVEIVGSHIMNSAFHATLMDKDTTCEQLDLFMTKMFSILKIDAETLSKDLIYFAHETGTCANGGCAKVEMEALKRTFGEQNKKNILVTAVKGFTGHPMGVGLEDPVAITSLLRGKVPPLANHAVDDPLLGLCESQKPTASSNTHKRHFVLRFAAGFGSQYAYILYRKLV